MSRATKIVRGNAANIFSGTINNDNLYDILDKPEGGITNAQMTFALSNPGFVKLGSVYQCTDNGTYTAKHNYQFTSNGWVDTTLITDLSNVLTKLNGTDADKIPIIDNQGQIYASDNYFTIFDANDPTTATVGKVNQLFVNTTDNTIFRCSSVNAQGTTPETYSYTWTSIGGGSGGSGVTEITDSSIRITDLAAGIYKTTYQLTTTINYNGTSGTGSVSAGKGSILTVSTDGSTKWSWELINTSSSNISSVVYYGYTGTSSGGMIQFTTTQLSNLKNYLTYYYINTNATNYVYSSFGITKGLYYLTSCTKLYYNNSNYQSIGGHSLFYLYNITSSTTGTQTKTYYYWMLFGNINSSDPSISSGTTIKTVDSSTSTTTYSSQNVGSGAILGLILAASNYTKVQQSHSTSTTLYPILLRPVAKSTSGTTTTTSFNQNIYAQPSTGTIYATDFNINGTDISTYVDNKISAAIGSASQLLGNTGDL